MIRREHYYMLGAFVVGTLIVCTLVTPDLTGLAKVVINLKDHVKQSERAADRETEEAPSFGDFTGTAQDTPALIQFIRDQVIQPPSKRPYNLERPQLKDFSQYNQSTLADKLIFKGKKKGTFVEVGAIDGEYLSNTLYFERELEWTGLLIEPNFDTFEKIAVKGRKALAVNAGLSPAKSPKVLLLYHLGLKGAQSKGSGLSTGMHVDGYPLYSILLAANALEVDFFSLDIEGKEMKVLLTLPWDKVKFHVMCIDKQDSYSEMLAFLDLQGYKHIGNHKEDAWFVDKETFEKNKGLKI